MELGTGPLEGFRDPRKYLYPRFLGTGWCNFISLHPVVWGCHAAGVCRMLFSRQELAGQVALPLNRHFHEVASRSVIAAYLGQLQSL